MVQISTVQATRSKQVEQGLPVTEVQPRRTGTLSDLAEVTPRLCKKSPAAMDTLACDTHLMKQQEHCCQSQHLQHFNATSCMHVSFQMLGTCHVHFI